MYWQPSKCHASHRHVPKVSRFCTRSIARLPTTVNTLRIVHLLLRSPTSAAMR
ncbi:hypothetical protein BGZ60DRAFT_401468 [Tricladium varicosporioides]|nr:hypothetical protein BGZ60DRAFT_401468 [Hymenoscyphus varicosporioides]